MFQQLRQLLQHRNPRFVCTAAGELQPKPPEYIAYIDHEVMPGLGADSLAQLRNQLGDLPHLLAFYERYGSMRLFRDAVFQEGIGRVSAYYIAAPEAWAELHACAEDWFSSLDDDEAHDLLPEWITDYVVVGEIPNSANYFLVPLKGGVRGCSSHQICRLAHLRAQRTRSGTSSFLAQIRLGTDHGIEANSSLHTDATRQ